MVTKYKRPEDSLYPQLYHSFKAKARDSDELVEYFVEDLTEQHFGKAIELILKYFILEEPFQQAIKFAEKQPELFKIYFTGIFKERVSLACFVSGSYEMVALNALKVETKGIDRPFESDDKDLMVRMSSFSYVKNKFDVFEHYNVENYLSGGCLCVNSDYRGRGIATEMLKARSSLLQVLNLSVTSTVFTSLASQKAAAKAGYDLKSSTSYKEIQEKFPEMDFSRANTTNCETYALKVCRISLD